MSVDNSNFFSKSLKHGRHAKFTAECVTVRSNMARQQEGMVAVDEFGKSGPIHGVHTFISSKKLNGSRQ